MSLAQIQHRLDEVLSIHAKYPGDPDNEIFLQILRDSQFSAKLRLAIDIQRLVGLAVRLPGLRSHSVKDIIGGKIDHLAVQLLTCKCDVLGSGHVNLANLLHLVVILRQIHSRPGCTVYHHVRLDLRQHLLHSLFICDIQLHIRHFRHSTAVCSSTVLRSDIGTNTLVPSLCQFIHHIMAQLSADACHKNLHKIYSPLLYAFVK